MAHETAITQLPTNALQPRSQEHTRPAGDEDSVMMDLDVLSDDEALGESMGRLDISKDIDMISKAVQNATVDMTSEPNRAATVDNRSQVPAAENKPRLRYKMGYRKDCEKCQLRVPGHYAHIF